MIMTRQEHLEQQEQHLTDESARDARTLQQLTRNVDKRYTSGTRDRIVAVALRLHDHRTELASVRRELKQRAAAVDAVRRELNQRAAAALLD